jgi:hypothetical protein
VQASGAVPAARRIVVALLTGLVRMWHCGGGGEVDGFVLNRPSLSFRMTCTTGFDQRRRAAWRP